MNERENYTKIKNFCDTASFERFRTQHDESGVRRLEFEDATAGALLERTLEAIDPRLFEKKYPELVALNTGMQIDNTGGEVANSIKSRRTDAQGEFVLSDDDAIKGQVSIGSEDSTLKVYGKQTQVAWTDTQVAQAAAENRNLFNELIGAVDKIYKREIDDIFLTGGGLQNAGLLNHASIAAEAGAGAIETLTAQQMYDEISELIDDQRTAVNNTPEYMANTVIMPVNVWNLTSKTILNTASDRTSVLKALMENFPAVTRWMASFRAATAYTGGVSATIAFNNNPEAGLMRIPLPLRIGKVYDKGSFSRAADAKYRIGGFDLLEATAFRIMTNL